jgi:phenylpropionate dioxygenase-like ring-hydroxylating dioxygenase large terminal subunit
MTKARYRDHPEALAALVRPGEVHRDLYVNADLFALEDERVFARTWVYVGHASQVPNPGDYLTARIGSCPVLMVRREDGTIVVLINRCAHKGNAVVSEFCGNAGRALRCPYHAWTYGLDGALVAVPVKGDYGPDFTLSNAAKGLARAGAVAVEHGFVFARLSADGPDFKAYVGEALAALDNLAARAPEGELAVAGGPLRSVINCNWKIYLENIVDPVHPVSTHESAAQAAAKAGGAMANEGAAATALEQLLPFGVNYTFFGKSGARTYRNGHAILGTKASLHSAYAALPDYEAMLERRHGAARAREILAFSPQNTVFFPSIAFKSMPQTVRVLRPLAVDRTLVETWALLPKGAPAALLQRTLMYNRLVFSPMSVIAHDDFAVFEAIQRSLAAQGNEWVSLHRGYRGAEDAEETRDFEDGNDERLMRNFYHAWQRLMTGAG